MALTFWHNPDDPMHRILLLMLNDHNYHPKTILSGCSEPVLGEEGLYTSGYTNIYFRYLFGRNRKDKIGA